MTDSMALRKLIDDKGLRYNYIAKQLGLSSYGLALKIDNKNEFKASEIKIFCSLLGITSLKKRDELFFADKVNK